MDIDSLEREHKMQIEKLTLEHQHQLELKQAEFNNQFGIGMMNQLLAIPELRSVIVERMNNSQSNT